MNAFLIRDDADLQRALALVEALWDATPGTPEHETLEVMAHLVDRYETERRALPAPDPLALVAFALRDRGWSQRRLARALGWGGGRVSEVLSGKRALTLRMVQELARVLELPAGLLVPRGAGGRAP